MSQLIDLILRLYPDTIHVSHMIHTSKSQVNHSSDMVYTAKLFNPVSDLLFGGWG